MIYSFAGTHRVGKSTLAKLWAEDRGYEFVPFSTSSVIQRFGYSSSENVDFEERLNIQVAVISEFNEAFQNHASASSDPVVTDRTPLDFYAYFMADVLRASTESKPELRTHAQNYLAVCLDSVYNLNLRNVCFIHPAIPIIDDPKSAGTCPIYQKHVHHIMHDQFASMKSRLDRNWIEVPVATVDLRARLDYVNFRWMR